MWKHFHEGFNGITGIPIVMCKWCSTGCDHPDSGKHKSTSVMHKHLTSCPSLSKKVKQKIEDSKAKKSTDSKPPVEFSEYEFKLRALKMQLANHLSFNFWDNPRTREFIQLLKDDAPPLNRHNMVEFLKDEANRIRNIIHEKLLTNASKISLALDTWSAPYSKKSYLCKIPIMVLSDSLGITAHFIDNEWNMVEGVIAFEEMVGRHTGKKMAQLVLNAVVKNSFTQKLGHVTADNAANNKKMLKVIEDTLLRKYKVAWKWKEYYIPCLSHVINLAVQALLADFKAQCSADDEYSGLESGPDPIIFKLRTTRSGD
jgi:hypothetical protein